MKEPASSELWLITALVAVVVMIIAVSWLGVYAAFELFNRLHYGNLAALSASEVVAEHVNEGQAVRTNQAGHCPMA
jgi:hypothetical protein